MKTIAVDLGGTRVKLGLVEDGVVIEKHIFAALAADGLCAQLAALEPELHSAGPADGIGFSFPGLVNPVLRKACSSNGKYFDAAQVDLRGWCLDRFGLDPVIENDANAALLGEIAYGAGKGCRNAVMFIVGTGIGTAAVMDGKLVRGRHFQAGCLGGHITVAAGGRLCTCGNRGCLEAYAGTWALPAIAREDALFGQSMLRFEPTIDYAALERGVRAGDALAAKLQRRCIGYWAAGILNLIYAYDPEKVILSGGAMKGAPLFWPELGRLVQGAAWMQWGTPELVRADDPEGSVLLGLHYLNGAAAEE